MYPPTPNGIYRTHRTMLISEAISWGLLLLLLVSVVINVSFKFVLNFFP
jgi:hypothetical protein